MNIFGVEDSPIDAANHLIDLHGNKMIVESSQLMGGSLAEMGYDGEFSLPSISPSHRSHPSFITVINSHYWFSWVGTHALELCRLYTERTGKIHKSQSKVEFMLDIYPKYITGRSKKLYTACDKYNGLCNDVVTVYRYFYVNSKICIASWNSNTTKPKWFNRLLLNKDDAVYFLNKRNKTRKNKIPLIQLEANINEYL